MASAPQGLVKVWPLQRFDRRQIVGRGRRDRWLSRPPPRAPAARPARARSPRPDAACRRAAARAAPRPGRARAAASTGRRLGQRHRRLDDVGGRQRAEPAPRDTRTAPSPTMTIDGRLRRAAATRAAASSGSGDRRRQSPPGTPRAGEPPVARHPATNTSPRWPSRHAHDQRRLVVPEPSTPPPALAASGSPTRACAPASAMPWIAATPMRRPGERPGTGHDGEQVDLVRCVQPVRRASNSNSSAGRRSPCVRAGSPALRLDPRRRATAPDCRRA